MSEGRKLSTPQCSPAPLMSVSVPTICDVALLVNGVVPHWRQKKCCAWAWCVIWYSLVLGLNASSYCNVFRTLAEKEIDTVKVTFVWILVISSSLSQAFCVGMGVYNRNELFQLLNRPQSLSVTVSTEASSSSLLASSLKFVPKARPRFMWGIVSVGFGLMMQGFNHLGGYLAGESPEGIFTVFVNVFQIFSEASIRALPTLLLVGACQVHVKHLQHFIQQVQFSRARMSASETTELYKELQEDVHHTDTRWRFWLLPVALCDIVAIFTEILRLIMEHRTDTIIQLTLCVAGIIAQAMYLASLVLPAATWNDTVNNAPAVLWMHDDSCTGVSAAVFYLEHKHCKIRVAGVAALSVSQVLYFAGMCTVGPFIGVGMEQLMKLKD